VGIDRISAGLSQRSGRVLHGCWDALPQIFRERTSLQGRAQSALFSHFGRSHSVAVVNL